MEMADTQRLTLLDHIFWVAWFSTGTATHSTIAVSSVALCSVCSPRQMKIRNRSDPMWTG